MKNYPLRLAFALLCVIAFCGNIQAKANPELCAQIRADIAKAEKAIDTQKSKPHPNVKKIADLQRKIVEKRPEAQKYCSPEELCSDAKVGIAKAVKALDALKGRQHQDEETIQYLDFEIISLKQQRFKNCESQEVCLISQADFQEERRKLSIEKSRMNPNSQVTDSLRENIELSRYFIQTSCPANDFCAVSKYQLKFARDDFAVERDSLYPDPNALEELDSLVTYYTEGIVGFCTQNEACAFVADDIPRTEEEIKSEKSRVYKNTDLISRRERYLSGIKNYQLENCVNESGSIRLAEAVVRGGRFLARMLRH